MWRVFIVRIFLFFWMFQAAPPIDDIELASPVPSPEDMPWQNFQQAPAPSMSGVRVVTGSSSCDQSAKAATSKQNQVGTKLNEAWAYVGSGHIPDPSRCKRIKRSFRRACKRSLFHGCAQYKGKELWPSMVPFRLKQMIMPELRDRPAVKPCVGPSMHSTPKALQIFSWNAFQSLQLDEWLSWCSSQPYTLVLVQETG